MFHSHGHGRTVHMWVRSSAFLLAFCLVLTPLCSSRCAAQSCSVSKAYSGVEAANHCHHGMSGGGEYGPKIGMVEPGCPASDFAVRAIGTQSQSFNSSSNIT